MNTFELDAHLLEQFNALGTNDKEDLIKQFKSVVGRDVSNDSCSFLLELSGWNVQKAVGAFYDYEIGTSQMFTPGCNGNQIDVCPIPCGTPASVTLDARIYPSSSGAPATPEFFKVNVENTGCIPWCEGASLRSEADPNIAKLATRSQDSGALTWLPIGPNGRINLPPAPPGQFIEIIVRVDTPSFDAVTNVRGPLIGALCFYSPTNDRFGEVLYCTALPDPVNQTWLFHRGVPEFPYHLDGDTVMDET